MDKEIVYNNGLLNSPVSTVIEIDNIGKSNIHEFYDYISKDIKTDNIILIGDTISKDTCNILEWVTPKLLLDGIFITVFVNAYLHKMPTYHFSKMVYVIDEGCEGIKHIKTVSMLRAEDIVLLSLSTVKDIKIILKSLRNNKCKIMFDSNKIDLISEGIYLTPFRGL